VFNSFHYPSPVFNETRPERVLESTQRRIAAGALIVAALNPLRESSGDILLVLLSAGDRKYGRNPVIRSSTTAEARLNGSEPATFGL
jgi:hypothetical protein